MRKIEYLVLHTTAGNRNWSAERVQEYFLKEKKWKVGGYHWMIEMSGEKKRMYADEQVTNGVLPFDTGLVASSGEGKRISKYISNKNSVHVNWIGGIDGAGNAVDNRTVMQKMAQEELIREYLKMYPDIQVLGHNQVARKDCPCFNVPLLCKGMGVAARNIYLFDHFGMLSQHNNKW